MQTNQNKLARLGFTDDGSNQLSYVVLGIILLGLITRFFFFNEFSFDKFMDRDLYRALVPDDYFWLGGSHLSGGGRTPGGLQNLYLVALDFISFGRIDIIYFLHVLFFLFATAHLAHTIGKNFSKQVGWLFLAFTLINYLGFEQTQILWNPALAVPMVFLGISFAMKGLFQNRLIPWIMGFVFVGVASQLHLSNLNLVVIFLLSSVVLKRKWDWKFNLIGLFSLSIPYLLFLLQLDKAQGSALFDFRLSPLLSFASYSRIALEVLGNLFGVIFVYDGNLGLSWNYRSSLSDFSIARWIFPLASLSFVCLCLFGLKLALRKSDDILKKSSQTSMALTLGCLFLIVVTLLLSFSNQELNLRRFLWAQPYLILSLSIGFYALIGHRFFSTKKLAYALGFFGLTQIVFFSFSTLESHDFNSFRLKEEIVDVARNVYGFSHSQIKKNVGLISQDNTPGKEHLFYINTIRDDDGTGIMSLLAKKEDLKSDTSDCLMAIHPASGVPRTQESSPTNEELKKFLSQIHLAPEFSIKKIHTGKRALFFSYEPLSGNCLNFFENYYYIDEKLELAEALKGSKEKQVVTQEDPRNRSKSFSFFKEINFVDYLYSLKIRQREDLSLEAKVFQDTLQHWGVEELPEYLLVDRQTKTELIMKNLKTSKELVFPVFNFGSLHPSLAPKTLNFKTPSLPAGDYEVRLRVYPADNLPEEIQLSKEYRIESPKEPLN